MSDQFNQPPAGQEQTKVEIKIATPDDWGIYKNLRLEAIESEDGEVLAIIPERKEEERTRSDQAWQEDLTSSMYKKDFVLLSYSGSQAVGFTRLYEEFKGNWSILSVWVKPQFRNGAGKEMLKIAIEEIKRRKGEKIRAGINLKNIGVMHLAERSGFRKIGEDLESGHSLWELDLK
jgi:ribosomal protein S18 acetylase RimI-like enzyme